MSKVRLGSMLRVPIWPSVECALNFIAGSARLFSSSSEFIWVRVIVKGINAVVCHQLYCPKVDNLLGRYNRDCYSSLARSSSSTDSVKVSIRVLRNVVIDDVRDSVNV